MTRLAKALNRAGWGAPATAASEEDDWLPVRSRVGTDRARVADSWRIVRNPRPPTVPIASRFSAVETSAYDRIAAFVGDRCESRGARVVSLISTTWIATAGRAVFGGAISASRLRGGPVALVDGCAELMSHGADIHARDVGHGVWLVPALPSPPAALAEFFDALVSEFGLVFVHGPAATSDRALAIAAASRTTLLLAPSSGTGVAASVARLGRSSVAGVVAICSPDG